MIRYKFKSKVTGVEVVIDDVYTNCNSAIPLIISLYENSTEWIKIYPIHDLNSEAIADQFMQEFCSSLGSTYTNDYRLGVKNGVEAYIRKTLKK